MASWIRSLSQVIPLWLAAPETERAPQASVSLRLLLASMEPMQTLATVRAGSFWPALRRSGYKSQASIPIVQTVYYLRPRGRV